VLSIESNLSKFLSGIEHLMERVEELPLETAIELHNRLDEAAYLATANINRINPGLRVEICARQDEVLERVVDAQHIKECGLVEYTLSGVLNGLPGIAMYFGARQFDCPCIPAASRMEVLLADVSDDLKDINYEHLFNNYKKMDIVIFYIHGVHHFAIQFFKVYRKLRPDGIAIIAASSRSLRDALNLDPNVGFPCRWLALGLYNPTNIKMNRNAKKLAYMCHFKRMSLN